MNKMRREAERMAALVSTLPRGMQRAASHVVPKAPKSGGTAPDTSGRPKTACTVDHEGK